MNAIEWNRDLTRPLEHLRAREAPLRDKPDRGRGTVSLPELRGAGAALVVATQIARVEHDAYSPVAGWASQTQAWAMTQAQLAWYREMERSGEMTQIRDRSSLERHLASWAGGLAGSDGVAGGGGVSGGEGAAGQGAAQAQLPIGYILSLEGADSLVTLHHLERAFADGLRAVGPAHYGPGVYAQGTNATGGLGTRGRDLLREMDRLGIILDATHLCDDCFWEALDAFHGPVWASHHLCRALTPHNRQLSDEMIRALVERRAVIGMAFDAWMMVPGWVRGETTPAAVNLTLSRIVDHVDHVCQVAGSARHVALGTDLDGAFGTEQTPLDLTRYSDLGKLRDRLAERGYSATDVDGIMSSNALRFLREAWPA
jgi:membrane dipeptidase